MAPNRGSIPLALLFLLLGGFLGLVVFFAWPQTPTQLTGEAVIQAPIPAPERVPSVPKDQPLPQQVHHVVPFTSQSPFGEWSDPRQQDACEEASVLMAVKWARGETILSAQTAKDELLTIATFQTEKYGDSRDTSAVDTIERLLKGYYSYQNVELKTDVTQEELISELAHGNLIIVPMNGQALGNPHFTAPGPERHMVLLIGYDLEKQEFITNDPGIRQGKNYRYPFATFMAAIRDYETGYHLPITTVRKNGIVVYP